MKIEKISIKNEGYIYCKSSFYSSLDMLSSSKNYNFSTGINELNGEIDSGIWAVSYIMSMFKSDSNDFVLFDEPEIKVNDMAMPLEDFLRYSCYMDKCYPLFSTEGTIKELVLQGLKINDMNDTSEGIRNLFHIDSERFERPVSSVGNEIFNAMAAIGYTQKKQVFCFPWMSQKRFEGYHAHMSDLFNILNSLNSIVVLPKG